MVFVEVDKQGRLVLPKKMREEMGTSRFDAEIKENKMVFVPVREATELFGILKSTGVDLKKFTENFRRNHEREK